MKHYIRIVREKTVDGDVLERVVVYESKPHKFDYIVWI